MKSFEVIEPVRTLIPVPRWKERHLWPSKGQLRDLIFRQPNGFSSCIVRVGKRVLIDEVRFFEWVARQNAEVTRG